MVNRILADVDASFKSWARSPSAVFFTIVFPIILMTVFGFLFSPGDQKLTVAIQDNDNSDASHQLVAALNSTGALALRTIEPGRDPAAVAKEKDYHTTLVIPQGYAASVRSGATLRLISDPSRVQSQTAGSIIRAVVQEVNLRMSGAPERLQVQQEQVKLLGGGRYIDFFMPGVIGMTIMTNAIMGGLEVSAKLRSKGILRKIATTPIKRWEWVLAKVVYQCLMAAISSAIIILVAVFGFGVKIQFNLGWPLLIIGAAALFAGMAMILSRWVKEEDQANAAGSSISFPMMFLAGTFFPVESMPGFLQAFARILPLTYVNEAMRAAMVTGNDSALLLNGAATAVLALLAMGAGSALLRWKEV